MSKSNNSLITCAADVAMAYVAHNHVGPTELPTLLTTLHAVLCRLGTGTAPEVRSTPVVTERPTPAQIRKSVRPDGLVSFVDGRSYKTLKRHLTAHGLDPASYRERFGLPSDYPMVAPSYAAERSALAKAIGLGVPGAHAKQQAAE